MYSELEGASLCALCGHQTAARPCSVLQIATAPCCGMSVASCVRRFTSSSDVEIQTLPRPRGSGFGPKQPFVRVSNTGCRLRYAMPKPILFMAVDSLTGLFLRLLRIARGKIGDHCEQMRRKKSYATYQKFCIRSSEEINSPRSNDLPHGSLSPSLEAFGNDLQGARKEFLAAAGEK
jgi:hypothetical protein